MIHVASRESAAATAVLAAAAAPGQELRDLLVDMYSGKKKKTTKKQNKMVSLVYWQADGNYACLVHWVKPQLQTEGQTSIA